RKMELDDVVLYSDDSGNSAIMSERVSGLASSIYREFERLIGKYDEDVVKELMPLVVAVLENLESACAVNQEREVELELLKEDNEQLVTQYQREKALRKHAEERYIAFEDSHDGEKKDLQCRVLTMESHTRHLELKMKNYADQKNSADLRSEEAELKKEYNALHQRHTEMIHSYMEHLERVKHQNAAPAAEPSDTGSSPPSLNMSCCRKERPISMGIFQLSGSDGMTSDLHREPVDTCSEPWRFNNLSHPRSNTSLKISLPPFDTNSIVNISQSVEQLFPNQTDGGMTQENSLGEKADQYEVDLPAAWDEANASIQIYEEDKLEKSEVQAIIESTPELDMDLGSCRGTSIRRFQNISSTPTKVGIENLAFDRNTDSLFEELSSAANDLIGDVDEGADLLDEFSGLSDYNFLGMGREVEHLIHENTQLLETKNALNVVKNDLMARIDELNCEKEDLQGELDAVTQAKTKLEEKNKELEEELKKVRAELEDAKQKVKNENEDDSDVPTAQRKRFTRVEMARVLMERNQYKERLMELQEAIKWTEMIRASKETPTLQEKKKSSLWQFFSRLFSSSGGTAKKPVAAEAPVNVKYNAPTAQIQPSIKKKSSTLQQLPGDKSKAFDFLNEETPAVDVVSRREQKRAQYQQVKAHVQKEDGRVQAYGWSLPKKSKANGGQAESKMKNLPVPVFLRPLDEKDASMKLWCAAGVNLSGGKTRDGGSIVGASVFYNDVPGPESPKKKIGSQSSLDKLDQELKEQQKELRQQDEMSSLVWICTSTKSTSKAVVIDANQPGNILESFFVCNSHVLCIASVPGARETDYPTGEEVTQKAEATPAGNGSSQPAASSSAGGLAVLGDITVVGCEAGGTAVAQMEGGPGRGSTPAEDVTEAPEDGGRGACAKRIFADPLGAQHPAEAPPGYSQRESDLLKDGVGSNLSAEDPDLMREEAQKMSSVLPTMLGAQNGCVYVHSSVAQWKKCLHSIRLKDAVLGIVHVKGRVLVGLADGTLAIFHRGVDGQWDLDNYHQIELGKTNQSIRCMTVVHDKVWCGYKNKIYVVQPKAMKTEKSFDAHPRKDSQVRQLAWHGDGIWVSIRLDSTLRLFHAHTLQHLQDVDIEPYVSKMLGTGKLGFSFVRITTLMISCKRLWIGTGNGVIISIPLTEAIKYRESECVSLSANKANKASGNPPGSAVRVYGDESGDRVTAGTFVPFCSMAHAQLSFHGHRDAVKFFTAVPGHASSSVGGGEAAGDKTTDVSAQEGNKSMLVMSGGEGYIDFRMGDEDGDADESEDAPMKLQAKAERSHLIVWQLMMAED
uniref:C-Jun-amino-terminal kinase-interacting protein 4 n=1 Tax=Tetraodon nigroviridis TaxID=99883 RepID=H3D1S1_TETNG